MVFLPRNIRNKRIIRWITLFLLIIALFLAIAYPYLNRKKPVKDALTGIRERGYLVAMTDKNSLNYFVNRGNPQGFQLELLESFAEYLDVRLKIITSNDVSKLDYYLDIHAGDLIAMNLPITREGKREVHFSVPIGETRLVLIQRNSLPGKSSVKYIKDPKEFIGDTVYYRQNLFIEPILKEFVKKSGGKVTLIPETGKNTLELFKLVSEKKINYAICDENLAMVVKRNYRNIDAGLIISKFYDFAWAVSRDSDSLLMSINEWLTELKKKELRGIYLSYYDNQSVSKYFQNDFCSFTGSKLSPFDESLKSCGKMIRWDWRLLASLVYEESNFQAGLKSSRNASGLMQLMPETAKKFGMDSASTPGKQIAAGAKYVGYLYDLLPEEIKDPSERIYFTLASYNVGLGKVMRAREKAKLHGLDPNKWNRNVDFYLTWKSHKKPDLKADTTDDLSLYGTSGGFVDRIMQRYFHYRNLIPE